MTMFDRINQLSKKLGISLREVNDRAGLGTNAIYRWKNQKPSSDKVEKVAHVLGVTTDYLLNGREKSAPKTADLADNETIFTYEGKRIPPEDLEYMKRILRGGKA